MTIMKIVNFRSIVYRKCEHAMTWLLDSPGVSEISPLATSAATMPGFSCRS